MLLALVGDLDCIFSLAGAGSSVLARLREAERSFFTESAAGMVSISTSPSRSSSFKFISRRDLTVSCLSSRSSPAIVGVGAQKVVESQVEARKRKKF